YFGLWAGSFVRGELAPLREITAIMLREAEALAGSTEELNAVRLSGNANWFAGDFVEARVYLERALEMFYPLKDINLTIRFAQDLGVATMLFLGQVIWILGKFNESRGMMDEPLTRAKQVNHVGTTVYSHNGCALLALWRKDAAGVKFYTETVVELSRTHNLPMFAAWGAFLEAWSHWHLNGKSAGLG